MRRWDMDRYFLAYFDGSLLERRIEEKKTKKKTVKCQNIKEGMAEGTKESFVGWNFLFYFSQLIGLQPKTQKISTMKHKKKSKNTNVSPKSEPVERFTAEDLDAISSDDDTGASSGKDEWNAEALALRQAINDGAFNHLLKKFRKESDKKSNNKKEISTFIEADLDDSDDDDDKIEGKNIDDNEEEEDEEEEEDDDDDVEEEEIGDNDDDDDDEEGDNDEDDEVGDDDNDDIEEEEDNRETKKSKSFETDIREEGFDKENEDSEDDRSETNQDHTIRSKALTSIYNEISSNNMPWPETFVIQSKNASPFNGSEATVDIHDDLKREMAFYNMALDAVQEARTKCLQFKVPFSRPDDFFAEMVKSDGKSGFSPTSIS
jgi:Eukaryotic rRNA processing protein EBP2